jgi:hypothetical protein
MTRPGSRSDDLWEIVCPRCCPPGSNDDPAGRVARLTFPHFHRRTAGLSGAVRLERFEALPAAAQDACWDHLARALEGSAR